MRLPLRLAAASAAVVVSAAGLTAACAAPAFADDGVNLRPTVHLVGAQCGGRRTSLSFRFWDDHTPLDELTYGFVFDNNPGMFEGGNPVWWRGGLQRRFTLNLTKNAKGTADLVFAVTDAEGNSRRYPLTVRVGYQHMTGTDRTDVMVGWGSTHTLRGMGGDDVLCTGAGNDVLDGGAGRDWLGGGPNADQFVTDDADTLLDLSGADGDTQGAARG